MYHYVYGIDTEYISCVDIVYIYMYIRGLRPAQGQECRDEQDRTRKHCPGSRAESGKKFKPGITAGT